MRSVIAVQTKQVIRYVNTVNAPNLKKSNSVQNKPKALDVRLSISQEIDVVNKEKGSYEGKKLEPAFREIHSNLFNGHAKEICMEEQGHEYCFSIPNSLGPKKAEGSYVMKICMDYRQQSSYEVCILNSTPLRLSEKEKPELRIFVWIINNKKVMERAFHIPFESFGISTQWYRN